MADPLSISASLLAVLSAGISIGKALNTVIQGYREAPAAITALSNEVSDLVLVLREVRARAIEKDSGTNQSNLVTVVAKADAKLEELRIFVESLGVFTADRRTKRTYDRARWVGKKKRARELKESLRDIKCDLLLLVGAVTLNQVRRTSSSIDSITQDLQAVSLKQDKTHEEFSKYLRRHDTRLEEILQNQRQLLEATEFALSSAIQPSAMSHYSSETTQQSQSKQVAVLFRATRTTGLRSTCCGKWCICACHRRLRIRSPQVFNSFWGMLFLGVSAMPLITPNCNERTCGRHNAPSISLTYYFPRWLLNRALSLAFINALVPTASLKFPRVIDINEAIFSYTQFDREEDIKILFDQGLASPNDIDSSYGYSVLQHAIIWNNDTICALLLKAGADPFLEGRDGRTAIEFAQLKVLSKGRWDGWRWNVGLPRAPGRLRELFPYHSLFQDRGFSKIQQAVLESDPLGLSEVLNISANDINARGFGAYTALNWAVARLDPRCLETLLEYGADPSIPDGEGHLPLIMLSQLRNLDDRGQRKRVDCMRVLIRFGKFKYGHEFLDQGFPARSIETALMGACFWNQEAAVALLLAEGAEINVRNAFGETALSIGIRQRSHESLQAILSSGSMVALIGDNWWKVLKDAQGWADANTMRILIRAKMKLGPWVLSDAEWRNLEMPYDLRVMKYPERVPLWKEFIKDLKERSGMARFIAVSDEDCSDEISEEVDTSEGDQEEHFEDAVEYHTY